MRKIRVLMLSFALVAGLAPVVAHTHALAASCYASSCNNQLPGPSGCANDQIVVQEVAITGGGQTWGYVDLMYAPSCEAGWARVRATQGYAMSAVIQNANGQGYGGGVIGAVNAWAATPMQDATGNIGQRAEGIVYPNSGSAFNYFNYTNFH